jgi:hypothetical protein
MAAGALLAVARIAIHLDVQPRRTRVAAVDHRTAMAAPGPGPAPAGDPTPAADPAPVVPVGATSDPLIPPVEAAPEPPGKSPPTGTEETRKLPDFTHPEDATGTRVEEPARGRRRRSP